MKNASATRKPLADLLDTEKLRYLMFRRRMSQVTLARLMGKPVTTVNGWLVARHPAPVEIVGLIEEALGLDRGALCKDGTQASASSETAS